MLDCFGSFGVNVGSNNDGCGWVLVGQGKHFTDGHGFEDLMPVVHEFFGERVGGGGREQDEDHKTLSRRRQLSMAFWVLASVVSTSYRPCHRSVALQECSKALVRSLRGWNREKIRAWKITGITDTDM